MALKFQTRQIPQNPGIYFFKKGEKILYIGKAANLQARLRYYFNFKEVWRPCVRPTSKILILLREAASLSWEILGSEAEALIREAELIKKYRPKYNVLMRDDKQYFYVGFTREKFPKIFVTHQKNRKADYIGPFTEGGVLRNVLKTLRRAFPYCTCKCPHKRLCLNARIGRCLGYCCVSEQNLADEISRRGRAKFAKQILGLRKFQTQDFAEYAHNIKSIKQILSGKNRSLIRDLKNEMRKLSTAQKYEDAGKARDQIRALEKIFAHRGVIKQDIPTETQKALRYLESLLKIGEIKRIEAYDIADIGGKFAYGSMAVFANGSPQKNNYRLFKIRGIRGSNDPAMLKEVLGRRLKHPEWRYPDVIIVDGCQAQLGAAMRVLPAAKANIIALTKNRHHIGDHIFVQNRRAPVSLDKLPHSLKNFILMMDSEAHRFAISHYRRLHRKSLTKNSHA